MVMGRSVRRRQNVIRSQHQCRGFDLRFGRERNVNGHLVTVEVRIEGGTGQRMKLDGFTLHQHGLEGLNTRDGGA